MERLDPADGRRLLSLGCDLVWATTWMADANEIVAPRLGLPQLPIVPFSDDDEPERGLHWKTRGLTAWAGSRPFVWLDDEVTDADRRWIRAHHRPPPPTTRPPLAHHPLTIRPPRWCTASTLSPG
ncbi:hypothetical protein [Actinoplanes rishiriensis]|uniref:Uncharacterized protein n=1 Tax=Paractinoplanes rishiriensis TaxID=1050105 RepID=A0A919K7A6_9ACTN|nr:hypothetical protein Ari01nite_74740 [Actinoplanes rishiriensis]